MSNRYLPTLIAVVSLAAIVLTGCQSPFLSSTAYIDEQKAEAVKHELGTFDIYMAQDWETLDAETDPDFYQIATDGAYIERDAMLTSMQDEKLTVLPPDLGDIRVLMITPDAYMVTYPLIFNGSYDGTDFSNPRTVASLWVLRNGKWQNLFLVDQARTAEFVPAGN